MSSVDSTLFHSHNCLTVPRIPARVTEFVAVARRTVAFPNFAPVAFRGELPEPKLYLLGLVLLNKAQGMQSACQNTTSR